MKRVAVLFDTVPQVGGGHQYAHLILDGLLASEDIEVFALCTNSYWRNWCRSHDIEYISILWPSKNSIDPMLPGVLRRIWELYYSHTSFIDDLIKRHKISVLFLVSQLVYLPPLTIKTILPVHDLMHRYERRFNEVSCVYDQRERILKQQARYADVILTDSELGIQQYRESYGKFIKRNQKVIALPFTVPVGIRNGSEEYIETPKKFFFYPAQFWEHKNHMGLIKAVEELKEEIPDIHLLLPGSKKNYYHVVEEYAREHDLLEHVHFVGFISNGQMRYLYTHATAMLMPSFFGPTNIPPLEAMSLGCPVAVSNNYAMPEQIGDAGLSFDPSNSGEIADCMRKLWNDQKLREKLIKRGYDRTSEWSPEEFKRKVVDTVLSL